MKRWWKYAVLIAVLTVLAVPTLAQTWFVNPGNGHHYAFVESIDWQEAEDVAVAWGGHLVTINNQAENDWVLDLALSQTGAQRFWIGLFQNPDNQFESDMGWGWISGEPVTFLNWNLLTGEPFDPDGDEDFGELWVRTPLPDLLVPGSWNDTYWHNPDISYGLVERVRTADVPEPGTLALLAAAGTIGWRLRRRPRV